MFKITHNCELEFIEKLEAYFLENRSGEDRVYFSGEFDSIQTEFEKKSNNLDICVIAPTKKEGLVLLRLLRIIVDNNPLLMEDISFTWKEVDGREIIVDYIGKKQKMDRLITRVAKKERQYMSSFKPDEEFSVRLYGRNGRRVITKTINDVDVWDLERIMQEIKNVY